MHLIKLKLTMLTIPLLSSAAPDNRLESLTQPLLAQTLPATECSTLGIIGHAPHTSLCQKLQELYDRLIEPTNERIDLSHLVTIKGLNNSENYSLSNMRGILAYDCKYARQVAGADTLSLNGDARDKNNNAIWCRHLAHHVRDTWANAFEAKRAKTSCSEKRAEPEKYHQNLSSIEKIAEQPALKQADYNEVAWDKVSSEISFRFHEVGFVLQQVASKLNKHDQTSVLLNSPNHMMAIKIKRNGEQFSVNFYDPNQTAVHRRIVFSDLEAMQNLAPTDLTDNILLEEYALHGTQNQASLIVFDPLFDQRFIMQSDIPSPEDVHYFCANHDRTPEDTAQFVALLKSNVLNNDALSQHEKLAILRGESSEGVPALWRAMTKGYVENVKALTKLVLQTPKLSPLEKASLLESKSKTGAPGLWMALSEGKRETSRTFVAEILNTNKLTHAQKAEILSANNLQHAQGLAIALSKDNAEIVTDFMHQILDTDALTRQEKTRILLSQTPERNPGLFLALQQKHVGTIHAYLNAILDTQKLTQQEKLDLLQAPLENGYPLFTVIAYIEAPKDLTTQLVRRVLETQGLDDAHKLRLFEVQDPQSLATLKHAIAQDDSDKVRALMQTFFALARAA